VQRTIVAALGDSITAGSPGWDPDPEVRARIDPAPDPESQYQHWAGVRDRRLAFRNFGVYGQRTDEIAARLERCARGADVLVVQGGINDIAQGRPIEAAADNLRRMIEHGRELDLRVAIANVLPWNNGYPDADEPIRRLNLLITELAADEGVPVLPFYDVLEDPDRLGRMPDAWTSDGDHPSVDGYRRLGELAFALPSRSERKTK
jgi:lysophospholipase L1-like esterase